MSEDRIANLWGHLKTMDAEALRDHIRHIRQDRKTKKITATKRRAAVAKTENTVNKAKIAVDKLTPAQIEALLKRLEQDGT